ncbi:MAG: hypothetical protein ABII93_05735 [Chrysiogenia bacterium]
MADFTETRKLLERALQRRDDETLDLGAMKVERDIAGGLSIVDGDKTYSMARVPADVFDKLTAAIKNYNDISTDGGFF